MTIDSKSPIGVFDSGVGGISVLAELITHLPNESYVYYGDSKNAPYGVRDTQEVQDLAFRVVDHLMAHRIKGLVVACNTATSGAIEDLRRALDIPIVGMEPALKPAVALSDKGKILVMATPVTLREEKFNRLIKSMNKKREIIKLPCPGLPEIVETTGGRGTEAKDYLENLFSNYNMQRVSAIVLGCTHYIFIKEKIANIVGGDVQIIDGNRGAAKQLKRLLKKHNIINQAEDKQYTEVLFLNSLNKDKALLLSRELLEEQLGYLNWKGNIRYI